MTPLEKKIRSLIEAQGPMPVAEYMSVCLFDPENGYYTTSQPIGLQGDFVTAPEISQMFGELVAVWLIAAWTAGGRPRNPVICEIGAGRGTLMRDIVRTVGQLSPGMLENAAIRIVETSPRLQKEQQQTLADTGVNVRWHQAIDELPHQPLYVVANELFDAIPVRQLVCSERGWVERCVGINKNGALEFVASGLSIPGDVLPAGHAQQSVGAIFEHAPARAAMMTGLAARIAYDGGGGIFFDYGHTETGFGDTLQAVRGHKMVDVFDRPGEADITSHVDFRELALAAYREGLSARLMEQGRFLVKMGLVERAGQLGAGKPKAEQEGLKAAVERLAGADGMGTLFKCLAVYPPSLSLPPFDEQPNN